MKVELKKEGNKTIVITGGEYLAELDIQKELNNHFKKAKGVARDAVRDEGGFQETDKIVTAMDNFFNTLTGEQEKLYREWNDLRNEEKDKCEKELFIQGFLTGLTYAGEILIRGHLDKMEEGIHPKI